jgi:hypothetical protein
VTARAVPAIPVSLHLGSPLDFSLPLGTVTPNAALRTEDHDGPLRVLHLRADADLSAGLAELLRTAADLLEEGGGDSAADEAGNQGEQPG